uniref:Ribonuclease H-like domain-containing protein n=1 Tax=Tanacetum cinerariifolium TaxID=118510 RepID=A0A6L2JNE6_TANCI|nr:ribonuclease H-like domain-containing protein [Tanacetum cinerariifolium]
MEVWRGVWGYSKEGEMFGVLAGMAPASIKGLTSDPEEEIHLIEKLLYDNSSPRPPEDFISENSDAAIESFSPSPIPVDDNDSLMEEIDLTLTPDDSMPPRIEEDDYDFERHMLIFEELLSNDSFSLPENESFHFDIPSFPRPLSKPPDDDSGTLTVIMKVIKNRNKVLKRTVGTSEETYEPTSAEEKLDRRNEIKARGTLLMALPNKDQLKFHSYQDVKLLMEAIEKRYGGNKAELETISLDDLYNNLKIYEPGLLGSSNINQNPQNMDFVSSNSTGSTNEADTNASGVSTTHTQEDLEQIDLDDLEEIDLHWEMVMLTIRARRFMKRTGRNLDMNGQRLSFDKSKVKCFNCHKNGNFARECRALKNQDNREGMIGAIKLRNRFLQTMHSWHLPLQEVLQVLSLSVTVDVISNIVPSDFKTVESKHKTVDVNHKGVFGTEEPKPVMKNNFSPPILEDWHSDDESEEEISPTVEVTTVEPSIEKIKYLKPAREIDVRPIRNNSRRVNHKNFANKLTHPHPKKRFVPQAVLTRSSKINIAGASVNTAARLVNTTGSKSTVNHPRLKSKAYKRGHSQDTRPKNKFSAFKNSIFNKKVNDVRVNDSTARDRAVGNPQQKKYKEKGVINSGCSRHMTGNKSYLTDFEAYNGGFVSFGDGKGRISGKGKIKTGKLDFDDVYFCKELKCDNGTDFKNSVMNQFCEDKGIRREFSVARTPQQNRVAERRNRTLIEAVRTILVDSKLPTTFWAEVVNTACYVLNRALVIKPHIMTPFELIRGRPPIINFMKPFGCPVTILDTMDNLGKFEGKADEGILLGTQWSVKL